MGPKFNKHHGGWIILGTLVLAALFTCASTAPMA